MSFQGKQLPVEVVEMVVGLKLHYDEERKSGKFVSTKDAVRVAPFFVAFFKLPVYTVAGAALMGTFVTSVAGVVFYQFLSFFYPAQSIAPDWLLGVLFGSGGFVGMYAGARCQKYVPAHIIKAILCMCVLFVAGKYIYNFLV